MLQYKLCKLQPFIGSGNELRILFLSYRAFIEIHQYNTRRYMLLQDNPGICGGNGIKTDLYRTYHYIYIEILTAIEKSEPKWKLTLPNLNKQLCKVLNGVQ